MQKIINLLNRWSKRKPSANPVEVWPVSPYMIPAAIRFGYEYLRESGPLNDAYVIGNISEKFHALVNDENTTILMAFWDKKPVGMVIVGMVEPDLADNRLTGAVSFLYVDPASRGTDAALVALLQAAGAKLLESGCKVIRLTVDANKPKLQDHYVGMMGFTPKYTQIICETKEA